MSKLLSTREIKQIELEILLSFDQFCKEHNLYYTLAGGTLLGAIRHNGFIPWDDDIDVMMPREDYMRFVELTKHISIEENLGILTYENEEYNYPFLKVYRKNTVAKMIDNMTSHGIWIDVFPLDTLPSNLDEVKKFFKRTRALRALIISSTTNIAACKIDVKIVAKLALMGLTKVVGSKNICKFSDKYAQKYNIKQTGYIGGALWGYGCGERMPICEYMKSVDVNFEGFYFPAPSCWEMYLKGLYGDYMKLPPEEKRKVHNIKAWIMEGKIL